MISLKKRSRVLGIEPLEHRHLLAVAPVISELLASNERGILDGYGQPSDWIEIHNPSDQAMELGGWHLTDRISLPTKWTFPPVEIPARGFLMVFASGKEEGNFVDPAGKLHTNFRLDADGEYLALLDANMTVLDEFRPGFPTQRQDVSYGRAIDSDALGYFASPTPGELNSQRFDGITEDVVTVSHADRAFAAEFSVTLKTGRPDAAIHYTTDGTIPTAGSPLYSEPIAISKTVQLQARVIEPNRIPGPVAIRHFNQLAANAAEFTSQLPVMVIENYGKGSIPNSGWNQTNAGIRQVPRQSASMLLFEPTAGAATFSEDAKSSSRIGIRVRGAFSSSFPQPGYSVEAWSETDEDAVQIAPLGLSPSSDWVLYAPHPQYDETLIDNTFMFALSNELGRWAPRFRYVELFLNKDGDAVEMSDHVGLYVLVEKVERSPERINFPAMSDDGTSGGWLLDINRMNSITVDGQLPKNFHTAGPDGTRRTARDLHDSSSIGDDIPRQYNAYINFVDPSPGNVTERQRTSIEQWFQKMEDVLYGRDPAIGWMDPERGYAKYIDVDSLIDYLILCNLSKNGDALLLSLWMYNPDPAGDGKLRMGPIWDVDLGSFSGAANTEPMRNADQLWYGRLFRDPDFNQRYTDRWHELRQGPLSAERMTRIIDGLFEQIGNDAAKRDSVSNWPTRLQRMKDWVTQRAVAIDVSRIPPPTFSQPSGVVAAGTQVQISTPSGTIHLTFDGTDPRARGGEVAAGAVTWDPAQSLTIDRSTSIVARVLRNSRWSPPVRVRYDVVDLNGDGRNTEDDIHLIRAAILGNDQRYDQNGDGKLNLADVERFLKIGWNTSFGDANLDGRFDSADLVLVFAAGRFEDPDAAPASWSQGDWDCDGRFTTGDLVTAFAFGSYNLNAVVAKYRAIIDVLGDSRPSVP